MSKIRCRISSWDVLNFQKKKYEKECQGWTVLISWVNLVGKYIAIMVKEVKN